ncbi:MAG: helix-turn-helix transcriptional regulator [Armatimonadetes bacterium]|nr:helix-turn-helix transcriptional regulator [Armatimonadota bacterium]
MSIHHPISDKDRSAEFGLETERTFESAIYETREIHGSPFHCKRFKARFTLKEKGVLHSARDHRLVINRAGSAVMNLNNKARSLVVPGSVAFVPAGVSGNVLFSKGDHELSLLHIPIHEFAAVERFVNSRTNSHGARAWPIVTRLAIEGGLLELTEGGSDTVSLSLPAGILRAIADLGRLGRPVWVTEIPSALPPILAELIEEILSTSHLKWSLKDASAKVGYSTFHFSRLFKSSVGLGFHEFLERARTDTAIALLLNTNDQLDIISSRCGFGTTQSMRVAIKQHVGLTPSEFRFPG